MATKQQADQRRLRGWVRNLPDGRVEGVVCGPASQLAEFKQWLRQGPELAQVLHLEWQETVDCCLTGFEIR